MRSALKSHPPAGKIKERARQLAAGGRRRGLGSDADKLAARARGQAGSRRARARPAHARPAHAAHATRGRGVRTQRVEHARAPAQAFEKR